MVNICVNSFEETTALDYARKLYIYSSFNIHIASNTFLKYLEIVSFDRCHISAESLMLYPFAIMDKKTKS